MPRAGGDHLSAWPRPGPFLDPRREQAGDLSNAGRTQIRPAGGRINPAQVSLAVGVEWHHDDRAVPGPSGDDGAETLRTHDLIVT